MPVGNVPKTFLQPLLETAIFCKKLRKKLALRAQYLHPTHPIDMRSLHTPQEVAHLLNVSVDTIYRETNTGKLTGHRVGKQLRFTDTAIDEYLQRGVIKAKKHENWKTQLKSIGKQNETRFR